MTINLLPWTFTIGLIVIAIVFNYIKKKSKNTPPGPIAWPLIGNLLQIGKPRGYEKVEKMRSKYGDVFQVHIGSKPVVIVCGKAVDQCMNKNSIIFSMRPNLFLSKNILEGKSIAFSNLPVELHRRYKKVGIAELRQVISSSRNEGSCHSDLEVSMHEEAFEMGNNLVNLSAKQGLSEKDKSDEIARIILHSACNAASGVVYGRRSQLGDKRSQAMADLFVKGDESLSVAFEFFPFLKKVLRQKYQKTVSDLGNIKQLLLNEIKDFEASQTSNEISHRRENCLLGRTKQYWANEDQQDTEYEEEYLMNLNSDFFGAAVDTTRISFQWLIVYAATYRKVQNALREEIKTFRRKFDRYPTFSERTEFPYMMAYFTEVLRHSCLIPFTPAHCAVFDTELSGYFVPRGTIVMASFWSLNKSSEVWDNPDEFRPERFVSEAGKFDARLAEKVAAFGDGRRRCPGETLAKMEAFAFMNVLFDKFKFERTGNDVTELPERLSVALSVRPKILDIKTTCLSDLNGSVL